MNKAAEESMQGLDEHLGSKYDRSCSSSDDDAESSSSSANTFLRKASGLQKQSASLLQPGVRALGPNIMPNIAQVKEPSQGSCVDIDDILSSDEEGKIDLIDGHSIGDIRKTMQQNLKQQ